jgi:large subunit ribosomal protein L2
MGKRIIQQARGHGSLTYRVRKQAYKFKIEYPNMAGRGKVIALINSPAHSAPLAKILVNGRVFYNLACQGIAEGQEIELGKEVKLGNILELKDIPLTSQVYNIEIRPGDGGKIIRASGLYGVVSKKNPGEVMVMLPSKKEVAFNERCRASIGVIAGQGRLDKPLMKAGKMFYIKKARNKLWPRTSAVKMNVVDHPFGSGRGKNIGHGTKGKIPKLNAPPGAKVGSLTPSRTGRRKR